MACVSGASKRRKHHP